MVSAAYKTRIKGSVTSICSDGKHIFLTDNNNYLYILSQETFASVKTISLTPKNENLEIHRFSKAYANFQNHHVHLPLMQNGRSLMLHKKEGSMDKDSIANHHKRIVECAAFDSHGYLLATGGDDGVVNLLDMEHDLNLYSSFFPEPDTISALCFSASNTLIAYGSYAKNFTLMNIQTGSCEATLETEAIVDEIGFFKDRLLVLFQRDGVVLRYDILKKEFRETETHIQYWPTCAITCEENPDFLFIGTKEGKLIAYDMVHDDAVFSIPVHTAGITSLHIRHDLLFVGLSDGVFAAIKLEKHMDEMKVALSVSDFAEAYGVIEKNILLSTHKEYNENIDRSWKEKIYPDLAEKVQRGDIDDAGKMAAPYLHRKYRRKQYDDLLSRQQEFARLNDLIKSGQYRKAYELVGQHCFLRNTELYEMMENSWEKAVVKVRKMLEQGYENNKFAIRKIQTLYNGIIEKTRFLEELIQNDKTFRMAEDLVQKRNFPAYFELCNTFPMLKEALLFKKVLLMADQFVEKVIRLEKKEQYRDALALCRQLESFYHVNQILEDKAIWLAVVVELQNCIEQNKTIEAFDLIMDNAELKEYAFVENYIQSFTEVMDKTREPAYQGNPKAVLAMLGSIIEIRYFLERTKNIMKTAFRNEMEKSTAAKELWRAALKNYTSAFGADSEVERIAFSKGHDEAYYAVRDIQPDGRSVFFETIFKNWDNPES